MGQPHADLRGHLLKRRIDPAGVGCRYVIALGLGGLRQREGVGGGVVGLDLVAVDILQRNSVRADVEFPRTRRFYRAFRSGVVSAPRDTCQTGSGYSIRTTILFLRASRGLIDSRSAPPCIFSAP